MRKVKQSINQAPKTLSDIFGFKTESKSSFNIGDLIDMKDDWGPGMIYEFQLDSDAEEWKYKVSFPKVKKEKWFYEKKLKYFILKDQIKILRSKNNKEET